MVAVALVLYAVALVVLFGVRSLVQWRRTGSTGFRGISGTPREVGWWGGVLFVVAVLLGLAAPVAAVTGLVVPPPGPAGHPWVSAVGLLVAVAAFVGVAAGQRNMGASWRIGVEEADRTSLVTSGAFGAARNPIFTAMVLAQAGMVLAVPTWLSLLTLVALIAAVEIQVRAVEEPYLLRHHGAGYAAYAAQVGRFLPGVGRIRRPGQQVVC